MIVEYQCADRTFIFAVTQPWVLSVQDEVLRQMLETRHGEGSQASKAKHLSSFSCVTRVSGDKGNSSLWQ